MAWCNGNLRAFQFVFALKAEPPVKRFAELRGVQTHARFARQSVERGLHQPGADAGAALGRIDQHHREPAKAAGITEKRYGADHVALVLGDAAASLRGI